MGFLWEIGILLAIFAPKIRLTGQKMAFPDSVFAPLKIRDASQGTDKTENVIADHGLQKMT